MKKILLLLVMTVSLSCQDEVSIETKQIDISQKDYDAQIVYAHTNLLTLGHAALRAAGDKDFRQTLYNEVEVQFDGNYNVLLEVLSNREASDKSKIGSRMASTKNESQAIDNAILAFKGIEGEDYHPQIYIPHYEDLKSTKSSGRAKLLSTETSPTLIIYIGDEEKEVYTGFKIDNAGELQEIATPVDETYAQNNETWVLSLNESLIPDCEFQEMMSGKTNSSGRCSGHGGGGSSGGGIPSYSPKFQKMKVKCHKESWVAGKSEISLIRYYSGIRIGISYEGVYKRIGSSDATGSRIRKFSRNDVKYKRNISINYVYAASFDTNGWDNAYSAINYVIFECDAWPTGKKNVDVWHPLISDLYSNTLARRIRAVNVKYRSADSFYAAGGIWGASPGQIAFSGGLTLKNEFDSYSVNNGCIEFNSTL